MMQAATKEDKNTRERRAVSPTTCHKRAPAGCRGWMAVVLGCIYHGGGPPTSQSHAPSTMAVVLGCSLVKEEHLFLNMFEG